VVLVWFSDLVDNNECPHHEAEVVETISSLQEQWQHLLEKIEEKTQKLREANQQQQFNEAVNDMDFWLGDVRQSSYSILISFVC